MPRSTEENAYSMLRKIYSQSGGQTGVPVFLGFPKEEDVMNRQEWDAAYKFLTDMGWITGTGSFYQATLTDMGVQVAQRLQNA